MEESDDVYCTYPYKHALHDINIQLTHEHQDNICIFGEERSSAACPVVTVKPEGSLSTSTSSLTKEASFSG